MEHIAVDLGGRESQVCIRQSDSSIILERRIRTDELPAFLAKRPFSRVILETCAEAFSIADSALETGHQVRVVAATLVRSLGVGARGIKNDRRDAQLLSQVSCRIDLPSVHIPSSQSRVCKTLCGMREALLRARTQLINCVRGWLRASAQRIRRGCPSTFPNRVQQSCQDVPQHVERLLQSIQQLNEQIRQADKELRSLAKENPVCQRMMSVPGIGPVTAVRFVAAIDQPARFSNAHAVQSYLGLTPGERSSSEKHCRTGITKAGSSAVRRTLIQGAWMTWRTRPADPMVRWTEQIAQRRGKNIAVVALARKLAGILFALWRDGTVYDPTRGATPVPIPIVEQLAQTLTEQNAA